MLLQPSFNLKFGEPVRQSLVVVGNFDGTSVSSLACVAASGKVIFHYRNDESPSAGQSFKYFNFNRKITAIASGNVSDSNSSQDVLFIGTNSNISAYDTKRNSDVYFKDAPAGVCAIIVGTLSSLSPTPMVIFGGNCVVVGLDNIGNEIYSILIGDNVSALAICDVDGDGENELIVGSDDFEIRIYKGTQLSSTLKETDRINLLCSVSKGGMFAFGLADGTVGVVKGVKTRVWRVSSKSVPTALIACDVNKDGADEIVTGWMNGTFTVRRIADGQILHKGSVDESSPVAALLYTDYKLESTNELIVCSQSGVVVGYHLADSETVTALKSVVSTNQHLARSSTLSRKNYYTSGITNSNSFNATSPVEFSEEDKSIAALISQKRELMIQLHQIERQVALIKSTINAENGTGPRRFPVGTIQSDTAITVDFTPHAASSSIQLTVNVNTDMLIAGVVVICPEGCLTEGSSHDTLWMAPVIPSRTVLVPLRPVKNHWQSCTLRVQAHVHLRGLPDQLHVIENKTSLPSFTCFRLLTTNGNCSYYEGERSDNDRSDSNIVTANVKGRVNVMIATNLDRIIDWLSSSFVLSSSIKINDRELQLKFLSVCGPASRLSTRLTEECTEINPDLIGVNRPIQLIFTENDSCSETMIKAEICTDSMDLAATILQDLTTYLGVLELSSEVHFPDEMMGLEEIAKKVSDLNDFRLSHAAVLANESRRITALVRRAEDSRALGDMPSLRRTYTTILSANTDLIRQNAIRGSYDELSFDSVKALNMTIQTAAKFRLGHAKVAFLSECQEALKSTNIGAVIRLIRFGSENVTS